MFIVGIFPKRKEGSVFSAKNGGVGKIVGGKGSKKRREVSLSNTNPF